MSSMRKNLSLNVLSRLSIFSLDFFLYLTRERMTNGESARWLILTLPQTKLAANFEVILFFFHLNTFLININDFLVWHCLNWCWIFILLYLLFILLDNSFFALLPSRAIGFNRTWNWILKMVFRLHNFFSC